MNNEILVSIIGGAGLAAVLAIWKLWVYPLPRKIREHFAELIQTVVHAETAPIKAELKPNGGTSLRDAVDRLSREQLSILAAIHQHSLREWAMRGFEDADRAFFEADHNGKLTKISQQVCIWTGRSLPELLGDRWATIISPTCREQVKRWWAATWADGSYGAMDQTYISADGEAIPVRVYAAPVIDPGTNAYLGHVGSITRLDSGRTEAE